MMRIAIDDAAWASPWRHRRVSEKVFWSLGLVITALAAPVVPGTLLVGVVSLLLILGPAKISWRMLAGAMAAPMVFIIFGVVSVLLSVGTTPVDPYWQFGFLSITPVSVSMAAKLLGHATCGTLAVMLLALSTPMVDLLNWLLKHKVPAPLVEVAELTYRMLFILWSTAVSLHDAQVRRCGAMSVRSMAQAKFRLQATASSAGTLLVRAWDRARRLEAGLQARGAEESLATTVAEPERSMTMWVSAGASIAVIWLVSLASVALI